MFVGVPVKLGEEGIDEIIEISLSDAELQSLHASADTVKSLVAHIGTMEKKGGSFVAFGVQSMAARGAGREW